MGTSIFRCGIVTGLYILRFKELLLANSSFIWATKHDCAARCLHDKACVSFFYNTNTGMCYLYNATVAPDHTALLPVRGVVYYMNKEKAGLCAHPYTYTQNGQYCLRTDTRRKGVKWAKANRICKRLRGHMLRIDTVDKNTYVMQQFPRMVRKGFWLGGSDKEEEGTWRWTDGSLVLSKFWDPIEPDGGTNQNCLALYVRTTKESVMGSVGCFNDRHFICERS